MGTAALLEDSGGVLEEEWITDVPTARAERATYLQAKRGIDIVVSALLLLAFAPAMLVIAVLIKATSRGGVLYKQERITLNRWAHGGHPRLRTFRIYKFRSMRRDADPELHRLHIEQYVRGNGANGNGGPGHARFKLAHDPRVTSVGRVLRRYSLDELPQLFNVLRGDISLVGPRPLPLYEVAQYEDDTRERFLVPPGITGLWQVSGRCDLSFEEMVALDLEYARVCSLGLDFRILIRTLPAVLGGTGAA